MSKTESGLNKLIVFLTHGLSFWFFLAVKIAGTTFAAWSWWWVLLPIVPVLSLFVKHFGL